MTPILLTTRYAVITFVVAAQLIIYGIILRLSPAFGFYEVVTERPILLVLTLFAVNFGLYLASLVLFLKLQPTSRTTAAIFGVAIVFRAIMLFSTPIQEVDIYRYVWDGYVSMLGISPFQYAPFEVLDASNDSQDKNVIRLRQAA